MHSNEDVSLQDIFQDEDSLVGHVVGMAFNGNSLVVHKEAGPKALGKTSLLKREFFKSGVSGPSLPVKQEKVNSLDGMSPVGVGLNLLIDKEFLMNVVGIGLQEAFPTEFEKFLWQFLSCGPAR